MSMQGWVLIPPGFGGGRGQIPGGRGGSLSAGGRTSQRAITNDTRLIQIRQFRVILQANILEIGDVGENAIGAGQLRGRPVRRGFGGFGARQLRRRVGGRSTNGRHFIDLQESKTSLSTTGRRKDRARRICTLYEGPTREGVKKREKREKYGSRAGGYGRIGRKRMNGRIGDQQ